MDKSNAGVKFILTLISIYRVFPTVQRAKLDTIIAPFTGTATVFDFALIKRALKDLSIFRLPHSDFKMINLESASPLATKSLWGSNFDLVAL